MQNPKTRGRPHQTVLQTHVIVGLLGNPNCLLQGELCLLTNDRLNINIPVTIASMQASVAGSHSPRTARPCAASGCSCSYLWTAFSWLPNPRGRKHPLWRRGRPSRGCLGKGTVFLAASKMFVPALQCQEDSKEKTNSLLSVKLFSTLFKTQQNHKKPNPPYAVATLSSLN